LRDDEGGSGLEVVEGLGTSFGGGSIGATFDMLE